MNEPRPKKHRKKCVLKFGEKPKRPRSWSSQPHESEIQMDLDFINGDLPQEAVELFN